MTAKGHSIRYSTEDLFIYLLLSIIYLFIYII